MFQNNAYAQYRENAIFTSTPEELVLMLYNGLIKFIMLSQKALDEKNMNDAHNYIVRAQDIITEFQMALDKKYEISKSLDSIYDYMKYRLVDANVKKDKAILDEVLEMAKELRDTWSQAMKLAKRQRA